MSFESGAKTKPAEEVNGYEFIKKCRAVFNLYGRGSDSILTKDLGSALRAVGQIPSDQEVEMIASKLEQVGIFDKGYTKISFNDFYQVVLDNSEERDDIREMVLDSFKTLDRKSTGMVEAEKLTSLLTGFGETLTPAEMKELLQDAGVNKEGKMNYTKFVEELLLFEASTTDNQATGTPEKQEDRKERKLKHK